MPHPVDMDTRGEDERHLDMLGIFTILVLNRDSVKELYRTHGDCPA